MVSLHFLVCILSVIAALAYADADGPMMTKTCCAPDQWEGTQIVQFSSSSNGVGYMVEVVGTAHVDKKRMMQFFNQTVNTQDGSSYMQMVYQDLNKGVQYYIGQDGKCVMMNITITEPTCIPKDANLIRHSYIGAGPTMMKASIYQFMVDGALNYLTVQDEGCIPLMLERSGRDAQGVGYKMTVETFGITAGIADATVFKMPSMCMMQS